MVKAGTDNLEEWFLTSLMLDPLKTVHDVLTPTTIKLVLCYSITCYCYEWQHSICVF